MKNFVTIALLLGLAPGCGKSENSEPANTKAATTPEAKPTAEPEKPAAPTYKTPAEAITAMDACIAPDVNCPGFDQLVAMGPTATKDLLAIVTDEAKDSRIKGAVLKALVKAKDPAAAQPLYEAAKVEKNSLFAEELVEAAAAYGDEAIFQDLTANYVKLGLLDDGGMTARRGVAAYGKKAVAWAAAELPKAKEGIKYADIINDAATKEDLAVVQGLLGACKDPMVCDRLAVAAIKGGDKTHFDVFLKNLASKDEYERSDAGNMLAEVAADLPADLKPQAIELLQKAKAGDKGGLTSYGYDNALKALGATP